ncbi:uncharacterized protein [Ptychodera flava]|uniref:uncharacterized protein n=1 Tax=Ptychodera flava TaxID=63121 RepID=UPI00396A549B
MDQANQSKDTKVVLIWVGIGVAAFLIILVIIALILLFVRARKRFKELDEEIRMNSLRRSIKQYEGNINERSKDQGFEVATTEEFSKHNAGPAAEPDPGSNAESRGHNQSIQMISQG